MKKNKNKLIYMNFFLSQTVRRNLILFLFFGNAFICLLNAQTPKIWPALISFNYDEYSTTSDALNIRKNIDYEITSPEYIRNEYSVSKNSNCAYLINQVNRKIKVVFSSNNLTMNYLVKATIISGTGFGNVCEMFVAACDLNSTEFTIDVSGTLPASVGKRSFTWKWEAIALPINSPYCQITCSTINTEHSYYTLLATPQSPMSTPWTDVLDIACVWANNQSTDSDVLYNLCNKLYNNSGLEYNAYQTHYIYLYTSLEFHLSDFLAEWNFADCHDMSMFLSILSSSLGASLNQTRRIQGPFGTKIIDPVGVGPGNGWNTFTFYIHYVGWQNNIYDPCIRLKQTSPYIAIDINIDNPYKVDLCGGIAWTPYDPFILGQNDPYWNLPTEIK